MFDSMSGGFLEPGETGVLDFDAGVGAPHGGQPVAFDCYVKMVAPAGGGEVTCEVIRQGAGVIHRVGEMRMATSADPNHVPEFGLRAMCSRAGIGEFVGGTINVKNTGHTPVKVWRVRYAGPA